MLTAYIKPTNYCNVGCSHCYLSKEVRSDHYKMSMETLTATANMLNDMSMWRKGEDIHIIWHGGEPLVLNNNYFYESNEILSSILSSFSQSLQTSLIPYKSEHSVLIHSLFNSMVGSSIDFSARKIKDNSDEYIKLWLKKVDKARSDGILVIPGIVPSCKELERFKYIVDWCVKHEFSAINIERYNSFQNIDLNRPTNIQFSKFLIGLTDYILERMKDGLRSPSINILKAAINGVMSGRPGDRWGTSCTKDFLVIEPDGSTNNCPDKSSYELAYSNVHDGAINYIASKSRRLSIRNHITCHTNSYCSNCEFNAWCKTGCPITPNNEIECSGYKTYLIHLKQLISVPENASLLAYYVNSDNHTSVASL